MNKIDHLVTMRCSVGGKSLVLAFTWKPFDSHRLFQTLLQTKSAPSQQRHSHILTPPAGSATTLLRNGVRIVTNSIDLASRFPPIPIRSTGVSRQSHGARSHRTPLRSCVRSISGETHDRWWCPVGVRPL